MKGGYLPNAMPGFSDLTFSRCSLAKNMYAERPRLGALGSSHHMNRSAIAHHEVYPIASERSSEKGYHLIE